MQTARASPLFMRGTFRKIFKSKRLSGKIGGSRWLPGWLPNQPPPTRPTRERGKTTATFFARNSRAIPFWPLTREHSGILVGPCTTLPYATNNASCVRCVPLSYARMRAGVLRQRTALVPPLPHKKPKAGDEERRGKGPRRRLPTTTAYPWKEGVAFPDK